MVITKSLKSDVKAEFGASILLSTAKAEKAKAEKAKAEKAKAEKAKAEKAKVKAELNDKALKLIKILNNIPIEPIK